MSHSKPEKQKAKRVRKSKMLSIWIEPEARERLDRIAERDRRSVSSVVRLAIEFYLVGHGKESGEAAA